MATTLPEDREAASPAASARQRGLGRTGIATVSSPVVAALVGMTVLWSTTFITLGWIRQDRFATFGYDLGIYDQAIWLLSRFKDPFITIRGLEFFGHHMNPILVLFVPAYWVGGGPHVLLVVQVLAQASGAAAIYLIARDRLIERWLAVGLAAVLLLNPTYQYLTWEFFHPDALAIAPLLFAYWAGRAKRWGWFSVAAILALACKEDLSLVMVVLGLLIAVRGDRRIGVVVAAISAAWFFVATRVLIPAANGIGPFYDSFFGEFGNTPGEIVSNAATHPAKTFSVATRNDRLKYYRMMFSPVAFLPLAAPGTLLLAVPMLVINALSSFPYQREIIYHYAALVLAGIMLATVEAVAFLGRTRRLRQLLVGLLLVTSLATTVAWGPSPISTRYHNPLWPLEHDPRLPAYQAAVRAVPSGEPASAIYNFDVHLAHREKIYEFPEPWVYVNWGVRGEHLDNPAGVRWIVVDMAELGSVDTDLFNTLLATQFEVRYERDGIVVAHRVGAAGPGEPGGPQP